MKCRAMSVCFGGYALLLAISLSSQIDLFGCSVRAAARGATRGAARRSMAEGGCDGSLMAGISRVARRTNDDGALIACIIQAEAPKLSPIERHQQEQEQELGQPP